MVKSADTYDKIGCFYHYYMEKYLRAIKKLYLTLFWHAYLAALQLRAISSGVETIKLRACSIMLQLCN